MFQLPTQMLKLVFHFMVQFFESVVLFFVLSDCLFISLNFAGELLGLLG